MYVQLSLECNQSLTVSKLFGKGPIFRRMIVVPLENTITCGESMGTHDDEHDNFCQEGGVIVVQILQSNTTLGCRLHGSEVNTRVPQLLFSFWLWQ